MLVFSTTSSSLRTDFKKSKLLIGIVILFIGVWIYGYFNNIDKVDWFLENILVVFFGVYISYTYKKFQYSDVSYLCFLGFLLLHIYGARYAYTKNPLGEYFQNTFNLWRNPYDRIVHFSFGFFLSYPIRDLLVNRMNIKSKWQYLLAIEIVLSLASIFELIE